MPCFIEAANPELERADLKVQIVLCAAAKVTLNTGNSAPEQMAILAQGIVW